MNKNNWPGLFIFLLFLACEIEPYQEGRRFYGAYCANCHMEDGRGLRGLIPPLAQADFLTNYKEQTPCIIPFTYIQANDRQAPPIRQGHIPFQVDGTIDTIESD